MQEICQVNIIEREGDICKMLDNDNNKLFLSCGYLPHGRLLIVAILAYKRGWLGGGDGGGMGGGWVGGGGVGVL